MFPRTQQGQGDKRRAFNSTQYREYPWIEYSCHSTIHSTLEHQGCAMLAWPEYKKGAKSNTSLIVSVVKDNLDYIKAVAPAYCYTTYSPKKPSLDAGSLTEKIINCLKRYGLEYKTNLVTQGNDGTAIMSGKHAAVSAHIKVVAKHVFYVHCNTHCLNLVLVDTFKSVPEATCLFSLLQKLQGSYIHHKWLDVQREMYGGQPRELQKLSNTRWACRHFFLP
ncbi:hypothetical protein N1851_033797 [Merluccius polli]|uniref:DUF4371 domain-containing protein n=1 Tax=Merluccius polli TaxID=89951 RepID=A0AA47M0S9_MERPO|nr:hypothetical protein N1851_033797 [Merluccius polli]